MSDMTVRRSPGGRVRLGLLLLGGLAGFAGLPGCARLRGSDQLLKPTPERELAARHLQTPLEKHLCKAAVYPTAATDWRLVKVASLRGRGVSFEAALESLCREADGQRLPAIVDIFYWRIPGGWTPNYELRGTAVRFEDGFSPPTPPEWGNIRAPDMPPTTDEEPPPAGEVASKKS